MGGAFASTKWSVLASFELIRPRIEWRLLKSEVAQSRRMSIRGLLCYTMIEAGCVEPPRQIRLVNFEPGTSGAQPAFFLD